MPRAFAHGMHFLHACMHSHAHAGVHGYARGAEYKFLGDNQRTIGIARPTIRV